MSNGTRAHIIAHSMGGLDARWAIAAGGLADQVASLATLGTPHRGTTIGDQSLPILPELSPPVKAVAIAVDTLRVLPGAGSFEFADHILQDVRQTKLDQLRRGVYALTTNGAVVADAKANLVLPQIISGAIALWPVRDQEREWKLEMDVDHVKWNSVRTTAIALSNGSGLPLPQDWRSSYNVMVGTEYKFLKIERMPEWEVAWRAGYTHFQTQMPDQTFNPGIPSADVHIPSVGVGFMCKENGSFFGLTRCGNLGMGNMKPKAIGLDLSYQFAYYEDRTIVGHASNPAIDGTYKTSIHAGGVTLRFNF